MNTLNEIGLDRIKSEQLGIALNELLADYSIFYQNTRGFHWKISGDKFFELHVKFEELYNDLFVKIDEVAERILTLGSQPDHNYTSYQNLSKIEEVAEVGEANTVVQNILDSFKTLIIKQREIMDLAGEVGDEGTGALMSDNIREQEKLVWMYSSYLM